MPRVHWTGSQIGTLMAEQKNLCQNVESVQGRLFTNIKFWTDTMQAYIPSLGQETLT